MSGPRQNTASFLVAAGLNSLHRHRVGFGQCPVPAAAKRPDTYTYMNNLHDVLQLRVRYSETDQMGTFYNSRALEWFECGRTELMRRKLRLSYAELEAKGVFLPLVEAHLEFLGGARYDDLLDIASTVALSGRAKLRFEVHIAQNANRKPVVRGHTVHAFADAAGKPIRPPGWFLELVHRAAGPDENVLRGPEVHSAANVATRSSSSSSSSSQSKTGKSEDEDEDENDKN